MSREADLYKDKIEVSLDGRQIFYLFFGGAVIVGLVFVLGVMVGRRVEARGHTDRARVAATVDPLAALDRLEGGSGLSFQGALRGNDGPATDVEKTIAGLPKASGARPQASANHPAAGELPAKAEVKAEAKPEAKKDEAKKDEAKKTEPKADAKKDELKKTEAKPELKAEAKPDPKADGKKDETKKLDAKAEPKKLDAKPEPKKDETKPDAKAEDKKADAKKDDKADDKKTKYALQLSSFQDKAEAQAYLDSMKSAGFQAYITEGAVDGKQYFRIRMGSYKSMDAANEAKTELEKSTKKSAIVIKL